MQVISKLQIVIGDLNDFLPDSEIESRDRAAQILRASLDENLQALPGILDSKLIARLASNITNSRSNPRSAIESLLVVGRNFFKKQEPKKEVRSESYNPLSELIERQERDLIQRLKEVFPLSIIFDDIRIGKYELVFYLDGEWEQKIGFDDPSALDLFRELRCPNVLEFLDRVVQRCENDEGNRLIAISDPAEVDEFFMEN